MIRVRLLTEPEYRALLREKPGYRDYSESQFYHLLREKGDFTDVESLSLLCHLHGEEAVTGKWYRRTTADGKPCIPAISREAMYGLVVIQNSRQGRYTPLLETFTDYEVQERMEDHAMSDHVNPLVWQAFAQLDMDILLTFRLKDLDFSWSIPIEEEFILENYLINDVPTEVHIIDEYLHEPELRDGVWVAHNFLYDQKYWWGSDTAEILKFLDLEFARRTPLVKGLFPLYAFESMCRPSDDRDPFDLNRIREEQEEAERNPWQVLNHMDYLPEEGDSRRLLYLIIEEYDDGNFCLRDEISVKYPNYEEMLYEAMQAAKPDCEVFMLPVDVNECMGCAEDIRKAVCAFRMCDHVIETFGPEEGLREFEKLLRQVAEAEAGVRRETEEQDAQTME